MKKPFRVGITRGRWTRFATMEEARTFCNKVFDATGVVLCIEKAA